MAFEFTNAVKQEAAARQSGLCAECRKPLTPESQAHHVVPRQSGNPDNPNHAWLSTVDNCVYLCYECHRDGAHGYGNYRTFASSPEYFKHSHGDDKYAHKRWADRINHFWDSYRQDAGLRLAAESEE